MTNNSYGVGASSAAGAGSVQSSAPPYLHHNYHNSHQSSHHPPHHPQHSHGNKTIDIFSFLNSVTITLALTRVKSSFDFYFISGSSNSHQAGPSGSNSGFLQ